MSEELALEDKDRVTLRYFKRRMQEYDELREEIAEIRRDLSTEPDGSCGKTPSPETTPQA